MMPRYQSHQLEAALGVDLPEEICALLDGHFEEGGLVGEFGRVVDVARVLEGSPDLLRPGMMPPDFLPLVSNDFGDFLCARIGRDGQLFEICQWYHGGGDWIPWGRTMAEAILYDSLQQARRAGANATMFPLPLASWMADSLQTHPREFESLWSMFAAGEIHDGLKMLLACGWCSALVHRDLIDMALSSPLRLSRDPLLLQIADAAELQRWRFDARLVPEADRNRISQTLRLPVETWSAQNWSLASELARRMLRERIDLAWPWNITGWSELREGDGEQAKKTFLDGLEASAFTDQAVMMRSHWFDPRYGKFGVAQIAELLPLDESVASHPYLRALLDGQASATAPERAATYWIDCARQIPPDRADEAYLAWYRAGWDLGCPKWPRFREIFDGMVEATTACGWGPLAKLIQLHREALARR